MMKVKFRMFVVSLFVLVSLGAAGSVNAETGTAQEGGRFFGMVNSVDCEKGELRVAGKEGEMVFRINKDAALGGLKSCSEIAAGGRAVISFSVHEGNNIVRSLRYKGKRDAGPKKDPSAVSDASVRRKVFVGLVTSVDCDKGSINLQRVDDASIVEQFILSKDTLFNVGPGKGCGSIEKGALANLVYEERENGKKVKMIKTTEKGITR
jgi:hypothetical protein